MAIAATSDAGSERGAPREPVVPRLAATVALVRDATGGPEVYLMRRPPTVGESGPPAGIPTRSAGITPAAALHDGRTP